MWDLGTECAERDHVKAGSLIELDFVTDPTARKHAHDNFELLFVVAGEVDLSVGQDAHRLSQGDIAVVNVGQQHSYRASDDVVLARFLISCARVRELLGVDAVLFWCNSASDRNSAYDTLRRIITRILNEVVCDEGKNRLLLSSLYYQLLNCLVENFILSPRDERRVVEEDEENDRMRQIVSYLRENYRENITLQDLADMLFLSPTYVSRYIKRQCGTSFVKLISVIRMNHALEDMMYTDDPITKIALDNGFASVAAFNKVFKELYECTPSEYRRKHREGHRAKHDALAQSQRRARQCVRDYLDSNASLIATEGTSDTTVVLDMESPVENTWNFGAVRLVNVGTATDLLDAMVQDQLIAARDSMGVEYVRFWGMFDKDLYLDIHAEHGKRNFSRLDAVTDFLVRNGFKPYFDLGFKSRRILSTTTKVVHDWSDEGGFRDDDELQRFYSDLFYHVIKRYGSWEVKSWFFEVWEQPARDEGESGTFLYAQLSDDHHRAFFRRFDLIARALRSQLPGARIGGAGFPVRIYGDKGFRHLLSLWAEHAERPDFISLSCYPYQQEKIGGSYYEKRSSDLNFVRYGIELARGAMDATGFSGVPIHVSEYNLTLSNRNVLNDSCLKAAYLVANAIDCGDQADYLGHALLSDRFAEERDTAAVLFGGGGLLTKDGAAKPAFRAVEYLHLLYPDIAASHECCLVTRNPRGSVRLVCHNLKKLSYNYYRLEEDELGVDDLTKILCDMDHAEMGLQLRNLKNGQYVVKTHLVNVHHGSIQDTWRNMGMESNLTPKELEYLRVGSFGDISARSYEVVDGCLNLRWDMEPNEIRYLHIYRR